MDRHRRASAHAAPCDLGRGDVSRRYHQHTHDIRFVPGSAVRPVIPMRHIGIAVVLGTVLLLGTLIAGSVLILQNAIQTAARCRDGVGKLASVVASAVNRQLLQVDGALVSLPSLFTAADSDQKPEIDPNLAGRLLRALNFETFPFRDLLLVRPDGTVRRRHGHDLQFAAPAATTRRKCCVPPRCDRRGADIQLSHGRLVLVPHPPDQFADGRSAAGGGRNTSLVHYHAARARVGGARSPHLYGAAGWASPRQPAA